MSSGIWLKWFCSHLQSTRSTIHCPAVYFNPPTTKSDILPLTDSILHCCTNFTFYRFNSRQSLFSPAALFPLEFPGESRARFKFPPFHIQLRSLKAKGMQAVNLTEGRWTSVPGVNAVFNTKRETLINSQSVEEEQVG